MVLENLFMVLIALGAVTVTITIALLLLVLKLNASIGILQRMIGDTINILGSMSESITDASSRVSSLTASLNTLKETLSGLAEKVTRRAVRTSLTSVPSIQFPPVISSLADLCRHGIEGVIVLTKDGLPFEAYPPGFLGDTAGAYLTALKAIYGVLEGVNWVAVAGDRGPVYVAKLNIPEGEFYVVFTAREPVPAVIPQRLSSVVSEYIRRRLREISRASA